MTSTSTYNESGECRCCREVEVVRETLTRLNSRMNTMTQHVNMLCLMEGVKETVPRRFDEAEDDLAMYGDPEKAAAISVQTLSVARRYLQQARNEASLLKRTIADIEHPHDDRQCDVPSCKAVRPKRSVDAGELEECRRRAELFIPLLEDVRKMRLLLKNRSPLYICASHFVEQPSSTEGTNALDEDDDSEEVRRLKEALALPTAFQPSWKRRRLGGEDEEEERESLVKVEVLDNDDDDERLLSNNELLQQLLGGAIAGQITGEIDDNGAVYEGGEEEAEMEMLDNQEELAVEGEEEEEEDEEEEEENEGEEEEEQDDEEEEEDGEDYDEPPPALE